MFTFVGGIDGGGFGTDETGLFDGVFFVGFDADFAGFFERFLFYERDHLFEFGGDLEFIVGRRVSWCYWWLRGGGGGWWFGGADLVIAKGVGHCDGSSR